MYSHNKRTLAPARFSRRLLLGLFLPALDIPAQTVEPRARRTLVRDRDLDLPPSWRTIPVFGGGVLLGFENNNTAGPILFMIDREGRRDDMLFTIPEGHLIGIMNLAASSSGEVAVIGGVLNSDGRGTAFLARISADRKRQVVTRVFPYLPKIVGFAPGGDIWTIGNVADDTGIRDVAYHVLRRYDASGKTLDSRTLHISGEPGGESVSYLQASRDRVGWLTKPGEYIEFSPNGSEIARYEGPDGVDRPYGTAWHGRSLALSEDSDVFVGTYSKRVPAVYLLDRDTRSWVKIAVPKSDSPISMHDLLGFDGKDLVIAVNNGRLRRFQLLKAE